ncbi:MAG: c-type cytochrome [Armatimonadota bacterium]
MARTPQQITLWAGALVCLSMLAGCTRDGRYHPLGMWNDARIKPYEESPQPGEQSSARIPPVGTVARGTLPRTDVRVTGRGTDGRLVARSPVPVTAAVVARGQERYNVYCSPCHGVTGAGDGMIVRRGFPHPPDYAIQRLRDAPDGHYFDVITHGYGVMYSYASRVPVADRWAIVSYIRSLQKVRPVTTDDPYVGERERARERGIQDPARPMRLPQDEHGAPGAGGQATPPGGHAPGAGAAPGSMQQPPVAPEQDYGGTSTGGTATGH